MKHCIELKDLGREEIIRLITLAQDMIQDPEKYSQVCRGKKLATLFYEPSTRTRLSFTAAMMDLGGNVFGFSDAKSSSVSKGETVADTTRVVSTYADIIAMRHFLEGAPLVASQYGSIPIINAGDGSHAHPTQTLTDLLTIQREIGRLDNLTIGLCGDLKYGRTVHSMIKALSLFEGIKFVLIAPDNLRLPAYMLKELEQNTHLSYSESSTIEDCISQLDVLYMTRVQRERFESEEEYNSCKDCFVLDKEKLSSARQDMIVLHPLPRVNEISPEVDNDHRAAYFRQVGNGKYIRMALIYTLIQQADKKKEQQLWLDFPFENPILPKVEEGIEETIQPCPNKVCISNHEPLHRLYKTDKNQLKRCAYCDTLL